MSQISYQNLKTQLSNLKEKGEELMEEYKVKENFDLATGKTREFIQKYPLAAVAGSLLLGFALGVLLARDDD
jgi:ElaB/YqjD/DUF883 family membrane-anchored ribosome-binding protein